MILRTLRLAAACALAFAATPPTAIAQQPAPQGGGQQGQPAGKDDPKKEKDKESEFVEAARVLGGAAANPECLWLGRRVVILMWRDDLDTAFRHLDLYDRFGCPGGHIQATFRCVVRQGAPDPNPKSDTLPARAHQCWINPGLQPQTAAAPAAAPASPASGTNPQ